MTAVTQQIQALQKDVTIIKSDLKDIMEHFTNVVAEFVKHFDKQILASEKRMKRHFDVALENVRFEALGSQKDKLSVHDNRLDRHEERITTIERKVGIMA